MFVGILPRLRRSLRILLELSEQAPLLCSLAVVAGLLITFGFVAICNAILPPAGAAVASVTLIAVNGAINWLAFPPIARSWMIKLGAKPSKRLDADFSAPMRFCEEKPREK